MLKYNGNDRNFMTDAEYQKLVQRSAAFKAMNPADQQRILNARGADMDNFVAIFSEEYDLMRAAVSDYYDKTQEVIKDFKGQVKIKKKAKLKKDEEQDQADSAKIADKLLDALSKM